MFFKWLKQYMPRSLYGRALLILILPVVTLQLVVSVVFIQRHFEGVTDQLTNELVRTVEFTLDALPQAQREMKQLNIPLKAISSAQVPQENHYRWYDLSGVIVVWQLTHKLDSFVAIDLPDNKNFTMYLLHRGQYYSVEMRRDRATAANPHQLLVNMVFFGILMTLISLLYLRNQLRPITRLGKASEAFGRGRSIPYAPSGAVEVRAAGHAFLDMRARIERHIEQRTMMLSGVSHDLRTPLTRLRLGVSLLEDEDRIPLEKDIEDMQRLIDAFLDFARGDADSALAEPINPAELLTNIVEDARRAGQDVTLAPMTAREEKEVMIRPTAVRRVIENMLGNADRYANTCVVSMVRLEKVIRVTLEDDGPGIPEKDRQNAMRPFVRLDPARNQDLGSGVGLGLAIAADIVKSHGGTLRLGKSADLGGLKVEILLAV